jgi:transposase
MQVRKLLDTEASISLEARAALEEAQCALTAAKSDASQQLAKLRRELDSRDERIRKLEAQLRGAYNGLSRAAVRSSMAAAAAGDAGGVRVSRVGLGAVAGGVHGSLEAVIAGLGPHENVIELVVAEAVLTVSGCSGRVQTSVANR